MTESRYWLHYYHYYYFYIFILFRESKGNSRGKETAVLVTPGDVDLLSRVAYSWTSMELHVLSILAILAAAHAFESQANLNAGVVIGDAFDYPCASDEKLWCWTCNERSQEACQEKGRYAQCVSTESDTKPMCQRELDTNAEGDVVKVKSFCQANVPNEPQKAPCVHIRAKEQCQAYLGVTRCKICSYADIDTTPLDVYPLSACGLEKPSNPCDSFNEFNETMVCRRSLEAVVPKQSPLVGRMKRQEPVHSASSEGHGEEESDLWCWECKHSQSDERCWAEGRHRRCADKLGADVDAICLRELKTTSEGRTTITRKCARRDRCDPRSMGFENGKCTTVGSDTVCKTCNYGDPDDAAVHGASGVYRCKTNRTPLSLSGDCEYLFSRDRCWNGVPESQDPGYKVTATMTTNPAGTRSWVSSVTLTIPGRNQVVTIGQGRAVTYNGLFLTPDQLPFITDDDEGKLIIANGTQFIHAFSHDPPVHVLYNGERSMQINIPRWMSGAGDHPGPSQLCGVCGPGLDEDRDSVLGHNAMGCKQVGQQGQKVGLGVIQGGLKVFLNLRAEHNSENCSNERQDEQKH
ncbi:hypothetical protein CAPTEDRAFT_199660 [Capitella teleta]|uniref:VWFD domain-containing protein n=1 Tax=Capitella teleta TaxID=283909 RepID=R7U970_CAPTE|nr:hypothetical protein CAPTEDRAFT_199660 [Capitella teleta]|eukprot:ELU02686.1 hypothetical protein CAPTEDRAFT_199660 [Capitella teleta]